MGEDSRGFRFNYDEACAVTNSSKSGQTGDEAARRSGGRIALLLAAGALVLLVLVWFGRDAGDEIKALELSDPLVF